MEEKKPKRPDFIVPYDERSLDKLYQSLKQEHEQGFLRYYQIFVDNVQVVGKTNNIQRFSGYRNFVDENTKCVRVRVFDGQSEKVFRYKEHLFYLGDSYEDEGSTPATALNGVPVGEARTQELLERERERWERTLLEKELTETRTSLKDAEQYIDLLEEELQEYKQKQDWNLRELTSVVLEGFLKKPAETSVQPLAGTSGQAAPQGGASFSRKAPKEGEERVQRWHAILGAIEQRFDQADANIVLRILTSLLKNPQNLYDVAALLDIPVPAAQTTSKNPTQ